MLSALYQRTGGSGSYSIRCLTVLTFVWLFQWPAQADTFPRQPGVDALHYVFRLTLGDDSNEIRGEATVNLRFVADNVREVFLDLASTSDGKGMTVSTVTRDGLPMSFTHRNNRLHIPFPSSLPVGGEVSVIVQYRGIPVDGLRLIANMHGERTAFSENWPNRARQWLPMIDHPYDKATGEFIVTAPAHYQVVANGLLVEEVDLPTGWRRTHYRQSAPIASWLYALGMARFSVHHAGTVRGVPLQSWVFPQDQEAGYRLFETTTRQAVEFFSDRIGPYPYDKIANVQAAGIGGDTEHATIIFYGEKGVASGSGAVVHEVAHQWWGNAVTQSDWDDVWLSEGFATYFTHLFREHYDGRDALVSGMKADVASIMRAGQNSPNTPAVHENLSDMGNVLNWFVYSKGSWVLHMLRGLVGTEMFWNGIRQYYSLHRHLNASTDDFRHVMERVSGRDLQWFFRQWLNRSGVPRLEGTWSYDAVARSLEVTLVQSQQAEPFRLPIEVEIATETQGTRVERLELTERRATFRFPAEREPVSVLLDPGTWLLMDPGPFTQVTQ